MVNDTTFIIKTFERPQMLYRLNNSIQVRYPDVPVIVADDSRVAVAEKPDGHNITYHRLPYDVGLSAGRNYLIDQVQTPYFVLLDDDFFFTGETKVEKLVALLDAGLFDLVGGAVRFGHRLQYYQGFIQQIGQTLYCSHLENQGGPVRCDVVWNFFAAKTDVIRRVRWDEELKLGEHLDFFMRCKERGVRVGHCPTVTINHDPQHPKGYAAMKGEKAIYYKKYFMQKRNIEIKGLLNRKEQEVA